MNKDPERNVLKYTDLRNLIKDVCIKYKLQYPPGAAMHLVIPEIIRKHPGCIFAVAKPQFQEHEGKYLFRLKAAVVKDREHKKRMSIFGEIGT